MNKKTALILTVGTNKDPLIFSINETKPDFLYFVHTDFTYKLALEILKDTNYNGEYEFKKLNEIDSLEEAFSKSREAIMELKRNNFEVIVDFTSGTKPMVSGLVLAAIGEGCKYSYIGTNSEEGRAKDGGCIVLKGFEAIKNQKDPFETYAISEFNQGMHFFNTYQFQAARENFQNAEKKLEKPLLKDLSALYLDIVNLYDYWDKFYKNFNNEYKLNTFLSDIILNNIEISSKLHLELNKNHPEFIKQLNQNKKFLDYKLDNNQDSSKRIKFYLPDLLNNALRRIEEEKFDDAVARLYRAMELVAQLRLYELNFINKEKVEEDLEFIIRRASFKNFPEKERKKILQRLGKLKRYNEKQNIDLSMKQDFILLNELNDDLGYEYKQSSRKNYDLMSKRNKSILAHGLNPINEQDALELYELVIDYSKMVFPEIEKYMELAKFPKFNI